MKWYFEGEGLEEMRRLRDDLNEMFGGGRAEPEAKKSKELTPEQLLDEYLNFPDERKQQELEDEKNE